MHQRYLDTGALLSATQASPSLRPPPPPTRPSPSNPTPTRSHTAGSFHQFPVFFFVPSSYSSPSPPLHLHLTLLKKKASCSPIVAFRRGHKKRGQDRCENSCGSGSSAPHGASEQVRFRTGGGARQVLDEAAAHECSCQNVCVSSPVMTC